MAYKRLSKSGATLKVRKAGEPTAALAFNKVGLFTHKFADTRRCKNCGYIIPKADDQPDFIVASDWFYMEVKETDSDGYMKIETLVTPVQRRRMALHEAYFFFVMRKEPDSSAPNGVSAFLIPFKDWIQIEEYILHTLSVKSIRKEETKKLPGGDVLLANYRLSWQVGHGKDIGHWVIPINFRDEWTGTNG